MGLSRLIESLTGEDEHLDQGLFPVSIKELKCTARKDRELKQLKNSK